MPQLKIYSTKTSFNITSTWTTVGRASEGKTTLAFSFSAIPAEAINIRTTVYATYDPSIPWGKTAAGYPMANQTSFQNVSGNLYRAQIEFADISVTSDVTFKYKSNGVSGHTSGSLRFDDVYILVEYDLPAADWTQYATSITPGNPIYGNVSITDKNKEYIFVFEVQYNNETSKTEVSSGTALNASFAIPTPVSWLSSVASHPLGVSANVYMYMKTSAGAIVVTSEPKTITLSVNGIVSPVAGSQSFGVSSAYNGMFLQNYSELTLSLSNFAGDKYGSTVTHVVFSGNGKSYTVNCSASTTSVSCPIGKINSTGSIVYTATVYDSRSNSASVSKSINVYAYTPVEIISAVVGRYDVNTGIADVSSGIDAYTKIRYTYTPLYSSNGNEPVEINSPSLLVSYTSPSIQVLTKTFPKYNNGAACVFSSGDIDISETFTITLSISDGITTSTVTRKLGTAAVYIRQDPKHNAIGFGCYPTLPTASSDKLGCVEISPDWDFRVGGQSISELIENSSSSQIVVSSTRPTNPRSGMIWLDIS